MKTIIMTILAALTLVAADPVPPTTGTGVNSTNTSNSAINQNFITSSSSGRQVVNTGGSVPMVQLQSYLGPWTTSGGSNILDNLAALPESLTLDQAKKMYVGGVEVRVNRMSDSSIRFTAIKFLSQFPTKVLVVDGKQYSIPDETKFKRLAFITLTGSNDATTLDVIAKSTLEAIKVGANAVLVLKRSVSSETSTFGMSLGFGGVSGQLSNEAATRSQAASFGTGIGKATAKAVYKDTMMVLAIHIPELDIK